MLQQSEPCAAGTCLHEECGQMKALIKSTEQAGSLQVADMPIPEPGPGEVLVQVKSAGICYSDVSILNNRYVGRKPIPLPLIMGHEGAGVIAELGSGVMGPAVGDRVALEPIIGCKRCNMCRVGFKNMCACWEHIGITRNGTFAEYVTIPSELTHKLPSSISFAEAALLEPLGLVVRTLEQSRPAVGETVLVIGPGSLGMMHLLAYRAAGASKVIMVGLNSDRVRLDLACELGATHAIAVSEDSPVEAIMDITDGLGADIVVETASSPEATRMAFDVAAARGRIVLFGLYPEARFSPLKMLRNGITVYGDVGALSRQFLRAIGWLESGKVNVKDLIKEPFTLARGSQAFEAVNHKRLIKVVFEV